MPTSNVVSSRSIRVCLAVRGESWGAGARWVRSRAARCALLAGWLWLGLAVQGRPLAAAEPDEPTNEFLSDVELAPFVVNGEKLSVSIYARTEHDRRYAEAFAEDVMRVVYEGVTDRTGRGLVIVGRKGEPHPVFVFRKFVAMAGAGQLNPEVVSHGAELVAAMQKWEDMFGRKGAENAGLVMEWDTIVKALPVPLQGIGSKLYQLAWTEDFDVERVELKLHALTLNDLTGDQFARFDWVFYLPPSSASGAALDEMVAAAMKKEKFGLMKRAAVRSALFVFKPAVKKAIEAMRQGMMFSAVVQARSGLSEDDVKALTGAYVRVLMPDFKLNGHSEGRRAVEAVQKQMEANAEYAQDPFVTPTRLAEFDPAAYDPFIGNYRDFGAKETTHRFARQPDGNYTWQYQDQELRVFHPVGQRRLVNDSGNMTIEFLVDATGAVTGVEERWVRRRKTVSREPSGA